MMIVDELKNILLAELGIAAYTFENAANLIDNMVEKGKMSVQQGKELSQELMRNMTNENTKSDPLTKEDMISILNTMNFANKADISEMNNRLSALEEKLQ